MFVYVDLYLLQVDLLMSERKEAKEAVQAQADSMKAAQVGQGVGAGACLVQSHPV